MARDDERDDDTLPFAFVAERPPGTSRPRGGEWYVDADAGTLTWSAQLAEAFALDAAAMTRPSDFLTRVHPDDADQVAIETAAAKEGRRSYAVRFRFRSGTGYRQALSWGEPEFVDGEQVGVRGGMLDVTQQVDPSRLEFQLAQLTALLDQNADPIWLLDDQDRIQSAPSGAGAIPGLHAGGSLDGVVRADDLDAFGDALAQVRSGGLGDRAEVIVGLIGANGPIDCEITLTNRIDDPAIGAIVVNAHDITEQLRAADRLRELAQIDPLTQLPNRARLMEELERALARRDRHGSAVSVLFCDLDGFKAINDDFGHAAGDRVLVEVARRLEVCVRREDLVARVSGDEFVVLTDNDGDQADGLAARILAVLHPSIDVGRASVRVTTSIGIASATADRTTAAELLERADDAMYAAKGRGGRRRRRFDSSLAAQRRSRIELQAGLRDALDLEQLTMHFQPQIDLLTGRAVGAEALLRWTHPDRGVLAAGTFLPTAFSVGLADEIGILALDRTCELVAAFGCGTEDARLEHVSVNITPAALVDPTFPATVLAALARAGAEPAGLRLELTEDALLSDRGTAVSNLDTLAGAGVEAGIDDFGTGYAALSHLEDLPVSFLKLDGSFIRRLRAGATSPVVSAVAGLADSLGLDVVAECVEGPGQVTALAGAGITCGQGWHWAAAMSATDLERWVGERRGATATTPG